MSEKPQSERQSFAYSKNFEGPHIDIFPDINGMKCTAWSATDVFEERDDAYRLLAKIAIGDIGYGEAQGLARDFFKEVNEEPCCYYNPDEEESDDE